MKRNLNHKCNLLLAICMLAGFAAIGCSSTAANASGNQEAIQETPAGPITEVDMYEPGLSADEMGAYIDANWEAFGYSARPTRYIALSLDDGPATGALADNLLTTLAEKRVRATFFVIGQNVRNNGSAAKKLVDQGHELANHSDGYAGLGNNSKNPSKETIQTSLQACQEAIKAVTGTAPDMFRAPNVDYGPNLTAVCTEMGLPIIGVNVWSHDYQQQITSNQIRDNVLRDAKDGGIINCHEPNTAPKTVPVLAEIIDGLRAKGYWICSVSELTRIKDKTLEAGVQYDSIN
jgi:peptidoglycan/xylan/chitin deacetylase (PgdA/CDA1 family)